MFINNHHNISLIIIIFLSISIISAHLEGGQDNKIDNFTADFGYTPKNPSKNQQVFMSFSLIDQISNQSAEITSTWIRISDDKDTLFSGEILNKDNFSLLYYKFPKQGNYQIKVRFNNNEDQIAETDFTLTVIYSWDTFKIIKILIIITLILLIIKHRQKIFKK